VRSSNHLNHTRRAGDRINANAAHHRRIAGAGDQETRVERIDGPRHKVARMAFFIGPGRARKITHHAFIGDAGEQRLRIFGPDRPEQQPVTTVEHEQFLPRPPRRHQKLRKTGYGHEIWQFHGNCEGECKKGDEPPQN
jgi:hypothetical protein